MSMTKPLRSITRLTHVNRRPKGFQVALDAMTARVESQFRQFCKTTELSQRVALTPEERKLRQTIQRGLLKHLGVEEAAVTRLKTARKQRLVDLIKTEKLRHRPYEILFHEDHGENPANLEMWWGETNCWGNAPGISWSWQDDGPHFSGWVHVDSDDLRRYTLTIAAQFGLGADRIPPSSRGLVSSTPFANVFGFVYGVTKDFGFFNFDDQWAKTWLNTTQSVWVKIPGVQIPFFGGWMPWASNSDSRQLIFLEDMGVQETYLPGRIGLPPVQFNLIPAITEVQIDLVFSFDLQLEGGDSNLVFGQHRDWPSNVVQTSQWKLVPV